MSEFGLALPQIHDLTPRQIHTIYFHKRDREGKILAPQAAVQQADPRTRLSQLLAMAPRLGVPPDQIAEISRRLEALSGNS